MMLGAPHQTCARHRIGGMEPGRAQSRLEAGGVSNAVREAWVAKCSAMQKSQILEVHTSYPIRVVLSSRRGQGYDRLRDARLVGLPPASASPPPLPAAAPAAAAMRLTSTSARWCSAPVKINSGETTVTPCAGAHAHDGGVG